MFMPVMNQKSVLLIAIQPATTDKRLDESVFIAAPIYRQGYVFV